MTAPVGTIFFLPGLGFGPAAAAPLAAALGGCFRVVGIALPGQSLPGRGRAPDAADGSVSAMTDAALEVIEAEADGGPWMLVAHSMGGKVAALVAARVLAGRANVFGLAGAVLLAPSPPTPEPMDDDKRAQMLAWAEHGRLSEVHAREFVAQNVAKALAACLEGDGPKGDGLERHAVDQVRRTSPLSWRRWLQTGSREDVSAAVGSIDLPVTVLAGEDDADLGAAAQPQLLAGVYPRAEFVSLPDTGHLLPYERTAEVAASIVRLWRATVDRAPQVPAEWGRLIASERTAIEARGLLARRAVADDPHYAPQALSPRQLGTLRALADRLVPQQGESRIDLAARVDADLAAGRGDGWRPAELPRDADAHRIGLDTIAEVWPDEPAGQKAVIQSIIDGELAVDDSVWSPAELRLWFEDARTDLARAWAAHPATMARIGYDGFATSGSATQPGYVNLGAGIRDPWEPEGLGDLAAQADEEDAA